MVTFFEDLQRIVALERYVLRNVKFTQKGFVVGMIRLICTNDYRREFAYPVDQYYEHLVYIPERLKRFIVATAQRAADKAKAYLPASEIDKQARVSFQASQVNREADKKQMHLPPEKRSRPADPEHPFTDTSDEDEANEGNGQPKAKKAKKSKTGGKKSKNP